MALDEEFAFIFFYASLPFICDVFDLEIWGYLKLAALFVRVSIG